MSKSRVASILAVAACIITVGMVSASAAPLAPDTVGTKQVKDDSLRLADVTPAFRDKVNSTVGLRSDVDALQAEPQPFNVSATQSTGTATVADVGGTFGKFTDTVRATELDEFTLDPGRYILTADGFFSTLTADPTRDVRMQLAVRVDDGTDWGQDLGTAFTGTLSPLADREASTSSTRLVSFDAPTTVQVYAFGYEDDQGSAASGQVSATSVVTAEQIGE